MIKAQNRPRYYRPVYPKKQIKNFQDGHVTAPRERRPGNILVIFALDLRRSDWPDLNFRQNSGPG